MALPLLRLCGCMGILVAACAPAPVEIELMPTPGVFADGAADPFADPASLEGLPKLDLLYATLRSPALDEDPERFYTNDRGYVLRAGVARVEGGEGDLSVAEVRRLSLEEGRSEAFDLKVTSVQELGVIDASVFAPPEVQAGEEDARARFAVDVETRLSRGPSSDVFVYVHGNKVVVENPVLVASEMWHFLGYQGAMVAFSWPSTPSALAYFSDLETAALAAGRDPDAVRILGVSKRQPTERIAAAIAAGVKDLGENYLQEALQKMPAFGKEPVWHFVGRIQSNKSRSVAEHLSLIHI